jgi:FkbH-like protein
MTGHLAGEYVKFLRALAGGSKKCLVLDLDNTLWGGVVGEDGLGGIGLGPMYPGSAFVEFQRYVRRLHDRGVILAIASKNNPADVDEVFDRHEFMALERTHFARAEINWEPKSRSIATIARALNIGLEHVVFADDNPVEVEHVRETLPMVTVVQLPREPAEYVAALARHGWFDTLALSEEDRRRGELYRQRDAAESLRAESGSVEQFYRDLQMEIAIAPINDQSIARAAQLTQKTNQFNATTRRYTDAEVRQMAADARCTVRTVAVRDRFGDNGIVGLILARQDGATLDIDTLLLSCRVIGRTVETAMLAYACDDARRRGAARVSGRIIPTAKNAPVRDLFERHGFGKVGEEGDGVVRWELDLDESGVAWPDWFRVAALDLAPAVS